MPGLFDEITPKHVIVGAVYAAAAVAIVGVGLFALSRVRVVDPKDKALGELYMQKRNEYRGNNLRAMFDMPINKAIMQKYQLTDAYIDQHDIGDNFALSVWMIKQKLAIVHQPTPELQELLARDERLLVTNAHKFGFLSDVQAIQANVPHRTEKQQIGLEVTPGYEDLPRYLPST